MIDVQPGAQLLTLEYQNRHAVRIHIDRAGLSWLAHSKLAVSGAVALSDPEPAL